MPGLGVVADCSWVDESASSSGRPSSTALFVILNPVRVEGHRPGREFRQAFRGEQPRKLAEHQGCSKSVRKLSRMWMPADKRALLVCLCWRASTCLHRQDFSPAVLPYHDGNSNEALPLDIRYTEESFSSIWTGRRRSRSSTLTNTNV
jgi:hypothetical protein